MRRFLSFILPFFFMLYTFSSALSAQDLYGADKQNIIVTAKHPEFTIQLKSNPTTGYSWFLRRYNHYLITPISHRFEKPANPQLMGAPSIEIWTFRATPAAFTVPQQTILRFLYARPWEKNNKANEIT